jgi:protein tyrosine phosphatase (PTP) superfamily phosphohydrolase (DUF442 family)
MSTHTTIQGERGEVSKSRVIDAAAPLYHVNNLGPPVLVVAGGEDSPDREEVNRDYFKALADAGHKDVRLLVVEGRDHGTIISRVDQPHDEAAAAILGFIREYSADRVEAVEVGSIAPLHQCGDLLLAGQPSPKDLELLKQRGVRTIINLRHADEIDWDEAEAAAKHGFTYIHVPFRGEDELTDEVFDKVLAALRDNNGGQTMFHCGMSNRVAAIWYVHRVLDQGVAPEIAEKEAKQVGLRNLKYLMRARAYVDRRSSSE